MSRVIPICFIFWKSTLRRTNRSSIRVLMISILRFLRSIFRRFRISSFQPNFLAISPHGSGHDHVSVLYGSANTRRFTCDPLQPWKSEGCAWLSVKVRARSRVMSHTHSSRRFVGTFLFGRRRPRNTARSTDSRIGTNGVTKNRRNVQRRCGLTIRVVANRRAHEKTFFFVLHRKTVRVEVAARTVHLHSCGRCKIRYHCTEQHKG